MLTLIQFSIYIRLLEIMNNLEILFVLESPKLLNLHNNFLKMLYRFPMDVVSFSETKSTLVTALKFRLQFVEPESAGTVAYFTNEKNPVIYY